ncbi:hypothetical protein CSUI_001763, partial [Cystoisospora suis]
ERLRRPRNPSSPADRPRIPIPEKSILQFPPCGRSKQQSKRLARQSGPLLARASGLNSRQPSFLSHSCTLLLLPHSVLSESPMEKLGSASLLVGWVPELGVYGQCSNRTFPGAHQDAVWDRRPLVACPVVSPMTPRRINQF